jgi:hypothetical protein
VPADLEPIELSAPPVPRPTRERRRWVVIALVVVIVAQLGGAVAALALGADGPSPAETLAHARAFARTQRQASFTGRLRIEIGPRGEGESVVEQGRVRGTVHLPDRARYVLTDAETVTELITVGDTFYERHARADDGAALAREKWASSDPSEADERSGVVRPPGPSGAEELFGDPIHLFRTLGAARRPVEVSAGNDARVIRADVDPVAAFGVDAPDAPDRAHLLVTVRGTRLDRLVLIGAGDEGNARIDYRFTDWGSPVEIAAPPRRDLDPTPDIAEEDIAAFDEVPLLQPRGIPEGWGLVAAVVLSADETVEGCEQLEIDYVDPEDPDEGYLTLYEFPKSCADLEPPRGARPLASGWVMETDDDGVLAQLIVGDTVVQAETQLSVEQLGRILSDLVPFDLGAPPAGLPGFGGTATA